MAACWLCRKNEFPDKPLQLPGCTTSFSGQETCWKQQLCLSPACSGVAPAPQQQPCTQPCCPKESHCHLKGKDKGFRKITIEKSRCILQYKAEPFCSYENGIQQWTEVCFVDLKTASGKIKNANITRIFLNQIHAVTLLVISKGNAVNFSACQNIEM